MRTEIGSKFWEYSTETPREKKLWWEQDGCSRAHFKSGRNAIKAVCDLLTGRKGQRILFPAYHCKTETEAWYEKGWEVIYYPILEDFTPDKAWLAKSLAESRPDVLFIQSYYGFCSFDAECERILRDWRASGGVLIEDITQSLLSDICFPEADFYVASLRKFFAIPDGGVLISRTGLQSFEKQAGDPGIVDCAVQACRMKADYFAAPRPEAKSAFLAKYDELDEMMCVNDQLYDISDLSRRIFSCFDIESASSARRRNYAYLYRHLQETGLFSLPLRLTDERTVPLYLPVLMKDRQTRERFRTYMAKEHAIYCPVIWPYPPRLTAGFACTDAVYNRILCFPIDQRYDPDDMQRVVNACTQWEEGKEA